MAPIFCHLHRKRLSKKSNAGLACEPRISAMKRKLAWVCLLVCPLVIGGAVLVLLPRDPITQANCDKIENGMTLTEVETLLGRKKDYEFATDTGPRHFIWFGPRGIIFVSM